MRERERSVCKERKRGNDGKIIDDMRNICERIFNVFTWINRKINKNYEWNSMENGTDKNWGNTVENETI